MPTANMGTGPLQPDNNDAGGDVIDIAAINAHLQRQKQHRLTSTRMQTLSRELRDAASDKQVVGDDFFVDVETQQRETRKMKVQVAIAGVGGRAHRTIKRFAGRRGSKFATIPLTSADNAADVPIEEDQDELGSQVDALSEGNQENVYGAPLRLTESPTGSTDSLSSGTTSLASTSGATSSAATPSSDRTGGWINTSPFEPLSRAPTLPTLTEQPSPQLQRVLSPRTRDEEEPNAPSRTLTLDEGKPQKGGGSHKRISKLRPTNLNHSLARRRHRLARRDTGLTDAEDDTLEKVLFKAGVVTQEKEKVTTDILYEHQRGLVVFGLPQFSSSALFQLDPSPWTNARLKNSSVTRHDHPLPTPFWHWLDREWMVDMGGDTDEQGWSYAVRFRSKFWRGQPDTWRSFVRRRRWIRRRIYIPSVVLMKPDMTLLADIDWSRQDFAFPTSFVSACAALPVSNAIKEDVYRWEQSEFIDAKSPFLPLKQIQTYLEASQQTNQRFQDCKTMTILRQAIVEINFHRTCLMLRECRLDREKLALWRWWLGLGAPDSDMAEATDTQACEMGSDDKDGQRRPSNVKPSRSFRSRQASVQLPHTKPSPSVDVKSWSKEDENPAMNDVWDLLEGKLDDILSLFEFQLSRMHLLHLVLLHHPAAHVHDHFSNKSPLTTKPLERTRETSKQFSQGLEDKINFYNDVKMLMDEFEGELADKFDAVKKREMGQAILKTKSDTNSIRAN
ncbi:hypothetical protein OIO90_005952 [Microbotryomycetes sp. JL221]|nr:hypothetical protein OIO90_005952 [Microbotryomycetes sp. JL221]